MEALCSALSSSGAASSTAVQDLMNVLHPASFQLDCHITSAGGCGSSHLSSFLNQQGFTTNLQVDSDGLRHCNSPPAWPASSSPRCVIYLYCDPLEAVASHYRRGHAWHQALKTCGRPRLREQRVESAFPSSLEAYCEAGQDLFGLVDHFRNWHRGAESYEVLMIKYDHIFDPLVARELFQRICLIRGLPSVQVETLTVEWVQSQKERKSQVPECCKSSRMYDELQEEMRSLPPLLVVPRQCPSSS